MLIENDNLEVYYIVGHKETGRTALSHYRDLNDAMSQYSYWLREGKVPYIDRVTITRKVDRLFDMNNWKEKRNA